MSLENSRTYSRLMTVLYVVIHTDNGNVGKVRSREYKKRGPGQKIEKPQRLCSKMFWQTYDGKLSDFSDTDNMCKSQILSIILN